MEDFNQNLVQNLADMLDVKNQKDLVDVLASVTKYSSSSIYNKLSGRSKFSIEELCLIATKYDFSLDELLMNKEKTSYVPFHADGLKYNPRNYNDYIQNIIKHFLFVKRQPEVRGYFIANQLPLFHLLDFPILIYLKLFNSNRTNWKIANISKDFNFQSFKSDMELTASIQYLKDLYRTFPNTEIWNPYILDNIIGQFQYFCEIEIITSPDDLYLFKREMTALIDYMENLTYKGLKPSNKKGYEPNISIYFSEVSLGSELLLIKSSNQSIMFHQIDVPNYMYTYDERMINRQYQYFTTLQNTSINITQSNEKEKAKLFKNLRNKIQQI